MSSINSFFVFASCENSRDVSECLTMVDLKILKKVSHISVYLINDIVTEPFKNVNIYHMIAHIYEIDPNKQIDGNLKNIKYILK